jgi:hypothetical protein
MKLGLDATEPMLSATDIAAVQASAPAIAVTGLSLLLLAAPAVQQQRKQRVRAARVSLPPPPLLSSSFAAMRPELLRIGDAAGKGTFVSHD